MYLRTIGRRFTQMITYFLVMKSKKCRKYNNRGSKELTLKEEKKGKEKENGGTHFYIHVNIAQRNLWWNQIFYGAEIFSFSVTRTYSR